MFNLTRNAAKCLICGEELESKHRHEFLQCSCRNLIVDGGLDKPKILFKKPNSFEDLRVFADEKIDLNLSEK